MKKYKDKKYKDKKYIQQQLQKIIFFAEKAGFVKVADKIDYALDYLYRESVYDVRLQKRFTMVIGGKK